MTITRFEKYILKIAYNCVMEDVLCSMYGLVYVMAKMMDYRLHSDIKNELN